MSSGAARRGWVAALLDSRAGLIATLVLFAVVLVGASAKLLVDWTGVLHPDAVALHMKLRPPLTMADADVTRPPPFGVYWLGTDQLGRDVLARLVDAVPVTLFVAMVAASLSMVVGVLVGGLAGFFGERRLGPLTLDSALMRFTDLVMCFPTFFLVLTVIALVPSSIVTVMVVIGLTSWMSTARFVRAELLSVRERDYILAARAIAVPPWQILARHALPNALTPVVVTAVLSVGNAVLIESALSFLGLGVQPPQATWGNMLSDGRGFVLDAPWLFLPPGLALLGLVLAVNLLGERLRDLHGGQA